MWVGLLMPGRGLSDFGSGFGWVGVPACLIFLHEECACIIKYGKCLRENWLEVQEHKCILLTAMNFNRSLPEE